MRELAQWLLGHDHYAITSHVNPDGDAVGSALGLMHILTLKGKRCFVTLQDAVPDKYTFLPGVRDIASPDNIPFTPKNMILVDCAERERAGGASALIDVAQGLACIDHHVTGTAFGSVSVIDPSASATGELILQLADALSARVTESIAACLYTAIITDCGNFGYSSTTPGTLMMAARCAAAGLNISELNYRLFREKAVPQVRLLGRALAGIEYIRDGAVALIRVTKQMKRECGASSDDVNGLVNFGVETRGVEVSLLAEEIDDGIGIGLRSKHYVNVAEAAAALGGGGHARASGATLRLPLEASIAAALREIDKRL